MDILLSSTPLLANIQTALEQPIFPGKIIIWILIMLSIVCWVMILSKSLQLFRAKRADREFGQRLRQSRETLQLFEEGWESSESPQFVIYFAGAREAAFQLLGSRKPEPEMQDRLARAARLSPLQAEMVTGAFDAGLRYAENLLSSGMAGFRFIYTAALLLGTVGGVWTLMTGFDSLEASAAMGPVIGGALGFVAISLLVASPAILARIAFSIHVEKRSYESRKFRDDISRLFLRKFAGSSIGSSSPATSETEDYRQDPRGKSTSGNDSSRSSSAGGTPKMRDDLDSELGTKRPESPSPGKPAGKESREGKRQYHSIRDRLLRPPEDAEEDEFVVNPIARQAAALQGR